MKNQSQKQNPNNQEQNNSGFVKGAKPLHQEQKSQSNELQAELQILASNYEALQQKLENSHEQLNSLLSLKETVSSFSEIKDKDEILVPLGSNIFTKAIIKKDDLIVGVGSDILVNKTPNEVFKIIDTQLEAINEFILKLETTLSEISSQILKTQLEANK